MSAQLELVAEKELPQFLPLLVPYLQKAADWGQQYHGLEEEHIRCMARKHDTWIVYDEDSMDILGFCISTVQITLGGKVFEVLAIGGREGELEGALPQVLAKLERIAKQNGCRAFEFNGRQGWWRFLKDAGYMKPYFHYFKRLS